MTQRQEAEEKIKAIFLEYWMQMNDVHSRRMMCESIRTEALPYFEGEVIDISSSEDIDKGIMTIRLKEGEVELTIDQYFDREESGDPFDKDLQRGNTTESWNNNEKGNLSSRKIVPVAIGDKVLDTYGNQGSFVVEEINADGWVWGSTMKEPFVNGVKNFLDNMITWKVE